MYSIERNLYNFSVNQLFEIGKRDNNPKRSFLFISKLLGKHLPVKPEIVRSTGFLLSSLKYRFDNTSFINCIKENTQPNYNLHANDNDVLVIGFCETATALGMAVASSIEGSTYITTTREPMYGYKQLVTFEESHSHASTHYMYSNEFTLSNYKKIILVDDEITTGNSLLHLIENLIHNSVIEEISIMTILDWRNAEQRLKFNEFSSSNKITINVYSIISGNITNTDNFVYRNQFIHPINDKVDIINLSIFPRVKVGTAYKEQTYLKDSGRLGITYDHILLIEEKAKDTALEISRRIKFKSNILVLGHGENIYIPSRVAAYLELQGYNVSFKTTSRTPIYSDGTVIKDINSFYDNGIKYHFYNKSEAEENDLVIMLSENNFKHKLCDNIMIFNI